MSQAFLQTQPDIWLSRYHQGSQRSTRRRGHGCPNAKEEVEVDEDGGVVSGRGEGGGRWEDC